MPHRPFPSSEYNLLNSLKPYLNYKKNARYPLAIGDDAAIRTCKEGEKLIITADSFVQDVHFSLSYMSLAEIGFKAMAINLSDCAAMGAVADGALVQLIFPKEIPSSTIVTRIRRLYAGILSACREWDFPVVGGNLSAGPCWIVDITLLGRASKGNRLLLRTGAQKGDALWVTGYPGESGAGFAALQKWERRRVPRAYRTLVRRHVRPTPRLEIGCVLAKNPMVHALIDVSDGIAKECRTLAYENKLRVSLADNPTCVSIPTKRLAADLEVDWRQWYLSGGEDYELLFAADPAFDPRSIAAGLSVPITRIGSFERASPRGDLVRTAAGTLGHYEGWDHLRKGLPK
jgi:thiamine-monophosphate kinase